MKPEAKPRASLLRARMKGRDQAQVLLRMRHEMESGERRDAQGREIPAWFIAEFKLQLNDQTVLSGQLGPGMGKDPQLEFILRGAKAGDRLQLDWTDNRGAQRSDNTTVQPA